MEGVPITPPVPPVRTTTTPAAAMELPAEEDAAGSPCSVNSDCSSVAQRRLRGGGAGVPRLWSGGGRGGVRGLGGLLGHRRGGGQGRRRGEERLRCRVRSALGVHVYLRPPPGDGGRCRRRAAVLRLAALDAHGEQYGRWTRSHLLPPPRALFRCI
ncbi:hypothetical protein ACQ4PT_040046 [Festuca glaucescens]